MNDDDLERELRDALAPPPAQPPADRVAALRARAELARAARGQGAPPSARPSPARPRSRTLLGLAAGVALLGAGTVAGLALSGSDGDDVLARGTPEFAAELSEGGVEVDIDGSAAPEGRIVVLESTTLPVLPVGDYYELWFVGADDAPGEPDRISAGTFHPDEDGRTRVVLHAAVDPALYPEIEITAETADGDPAPSDVVLLDGQVQLLE